MCLTLTYKNKVCVDCMLFVCTCLIKRIVNSTIARGLSYGCRQIEMVSEGVIHTYITTCFDRNILNFLITIDVN